MDQLLQRSVRCVTVLDISGVALARARTRLGPAADLVTWIEADVTADWPVPAVDIWHDRAVFHFLTDPVHRAEYVARVRRGLRKGGALIMATFGPDGPEKCSGLPVMKYSPQALAAELGRGFRLQESLAETHLTPSGVTQSFSYNRFSFEG